MTYFQVKNHGLAVVISLASYSIDENKDILLTADLMSDDEIDWELKCLIEELEKTREQAKTALKITTEKIQQEGLFPKNN